MSDDGSPNRPEYRVYRARPQLLGRLRGGRGVAALRDAERRRRESGRGAALLEPPRRRRRVTVGRVLTWVALLALAWMLVSLAVFLVSAELAPRPAPAAERALAGGSNILTGSTVLVLGSDRRPAWSKEPGADATGRADSIMLLRASVGSVRRLSVLRDSYAQIPGDGAQKINAAYAIGGAALTIRTVEGFLGNGLEVNHLVEVSFEDFPAFIDALGGIDVELERCVSSDPFSGRRFRLRRGKHHLNGRQALAFARVRKNRCAPGEDDRARAARQQQVLSAIRSRLFHPVTFARLPLVSWQAPRTLRTDLGGLGLLGLLVDVMTGGSGETRVLKPYGPGPGGSVTVSEGERERAVTHLLGP